MEKIQKTGSVSRWFMQNEGKIKVGEKVPVRPVEPLNFVTIHENNRGVSGSDWNMGTAGDKKTVVIMKNLMYNQQQQVTKPLK